MTAFNPDANFTSEVGLSLFFTGEELGLSAVVLNFQDLLEICRGSLGCHTDSRGNPSII